MASRGAYKMRQRQKTTRQSGFTLLEVMIALFVSGIVLAGIYLTYSNQQKSYMVTDQIAEMQQNLRAAMVMLTREIREAGCNPTMSSSPPGFLTATIGQMRFTRDIAGDALNPNQADGDTLDENEDVTLGFSAADDANANGIVDGGGADWSTEAELKRNVGFGFQPVAERIAAVEFNYILKDNTSTTTPAGSQIFDIIAVQVSVLTKAAIPDKEVNSNSYTTASGFVWGPFNDNFRRRFASTTIYCRNLGL